MAAVNHDERRAEVRFGVAGQLPVQVFSRDGDSIAFHLVDASTSGFGIVISQELAQGTQLFLDVADYKKIPFLVVWSVPEASNDDELEAPMFRTGISLVKNDIDLIAALNKRSSLMLIAKD